MPDSEVQRFVLLKILPADYPTLTNISILSYLRNPFHYLTYPPSVAHDHIVSYHQSTKIEFPAHEGKDIQTIKILDTNTPDNQTVGFANWRMNPVPRSRSIESMRPPGSDFRFIENFRKRMGPIAERIYNGETDIELNLMRVLPSYQGHGLEGMLLNWGLQQAEKLGKRIFLLASPEEKELYGSAGFASVGEVRMDLQEFGSDGVYIQTAMLWDGSKKRGKK